MSDFEFIIALAEKDSTYIGRVSFAEYPDCTVLVFHGQAGWHTEILRAGKPPILSNSKAVPIGYISEARELLENAS